MKPAEQFSKEPMSHANPDVALDFDQYGSIAGLLMAMNALRGACLQAESEFAVALAKVRPTHRASARNLVHYVVFRRHDLRALQDALSRRGLSSLGRSEDHVIASLDEVIGVLHCLDGNGPQDRGTPAGDSGQALLERNADALLGFMPADRATRIMVTLPSEAADDPDLVAGFIRAGMDVARINCAHDAAPLWSRMAGHVRAAAAEQGRACQVAMDLAGPKLRTGPLPLGPPVLRVRPQRDRRGVVLAPGQVWLNDGGDGDGSGSSGDLPVVPSGALSGCRAGDVFEFRDARRSRRQLIVAAVEAHRVLVETTRTTYFETGLELDAVGDQTGRNVMVGPLPRLETAIMLHAGDLLTLTRGPDAPGSQPSGALRVSCTLPEVHEHAQVGHRVWFDDGKIGAVITTSGVDELTLRIVDIAPTGARLRGGKGINLPDTELPIAALTEQDEHDLLSAVTIADIIDVSFVRSAADVEHVQRRLDALGASHLGIVLKIETVAGFAALPEVLLAAMSSERVGVMIARGDLAVEVGFERMAEVQEEILWLCEAAHVPVIWATEVLDRMARTGRPSRAEVTDVAFAARSECIMLNKGPYMVEAMTMLLDINRRMHDHHHKKRSLLRRLRAWD